MAQTLGQFIEECELFEYSNEYYELVKECSELALMERYIENQEFITECVDASVYTEGFFMEAASKETNKNVKNSFAKKAGNLKNKIVNFFKGIIPKIIAALTKFKNFFDSTSKSATKIYKRLSQSGVSKADCDKIINLYNSKIDKNAKGNGAGCVFHERQTFTPKLTFENDIPADDVLLTTRIIAGALSSTTVKLSQDSNTGTYNTTHKEIGAVPVKVISKVFKELTNRKNKNYDISGAIHTLEQAYEDVKNNGLVIDVDSRIIDKSIIDLQNMNTELALISDHFKNAKDKLENDTDAGTAEIDHDSKYYDLMIDGINKINSSVASTLTLYSSYITFRRAFITSMKYLLDHDEDDNTNTDTDNGSNTKSDNNDSSSDKE